MSKSSTKRHAGTSSACVENKHGSAEFVRIDLSTPQYNNLRVKHARGSIAVPDGTEYVEFVDCGELFRVTIPGSVGAIDFKSAVGLTEVRISESDDEDGQQITLDGCVNLRQLRLPHSASLVSARRTGLKHVRLPKGVEFANFQDCRYLNAVDFSPEIENLWLDLWGTRIKQISVPKHVRKGRINVSVGCVVQVGKTKVTATAGLNLKVGDLFVTCEKDANEFK